MPIAGSPQGLGGIDYASYVFGRFAALAPGITWHRYRIIAVPRSGMPPMPRDHVGRVLARAEIEAQPFELSADTIAHRLDQGMACIGAWRRDRLVGVNWLTAGAFDEDEVAVRFVPPAHAAWDTGLYVSPDERGGRAFAALWAATADWLGERGLNWSLSRIADYNLASWRSHVRMGGQPLGRVAVLGFGMRQWVWGKHVSCIDGQLQMRFPEPR